jgi:S1-C subfamily serine protease
VERTWIGAGIQDLTPDIAAVMKLDPRVGALINSIADGGPAARAQLHPGDVIASVGGHPVHDGRELIREILAHEVGQQVQFEVIRAGQHYGAMVTLTARPEPAVPVLPVQQQNVPQSGLGLGVRDLSAQQAVQLGLPAKTLPIVSTVVPGSSADRAGLRIGDVIVEADGIVDPTAQQLQQAAADGQLLLRLRRHEASFYAALRR